MRLISLLLILAGTSYARRKFKSGQESGSRDKLVGTVFSQPGRGNDATLSMTKMRQAKAYAQTPRVKDGPLASLLLAFVSARADPQSTRARQQFIRRCQEGQPWRRAFSPLCADAQDMATISEEAPPTSALSLPDVDVNADDALISLYTAPDDAAVATIRQNLVDQGVTVTFVLFVVGLLGLTIYSLFNTVKSNWDSQMAPKEEKKPEKSQEEMLMEKGNRYEKRYRKKRMKQMEEQEETGA